MKFNTKIEVDITDALDDNDITVHKTFLIYNHNDKLSYRLKGILNDNCKSGVEYIIERVIDKRKDWDDHQTYLKTTYLDADSDEQKTLKNTNDAIHYFYILVTNIHKLDLTKEQFVKKCNSKYEVVL